MFYYYFIENVFIEILGNVFLLNIILYHWKLIK